MNDDSQSSYKKNRAGVILVKAIAAGVLSTLPFWLWDFTYFYRKPLIPTVLGSVVFIISLGALTVADPNRWIKNTLVSFGTFLGSIILGVIGGLLFIRDTYGFLYGGFYGLGLGIVGLTGYWLVKLFKKLKISQQK